MKAIGIIVEYNPFHNGHLYHLNYVKEKYSDCIVIAIMSGNFVQRGEVSILSKWEKTKIALHYGIDIVLDLPFVFANEAADFFATNSLDILSYFEVSKIVFGSECGDKSMYYKYADIQLNNQDYYNHVKFFLDEGKNYPTACSLALKVITGEEVNLPNDILGLAYTKAIVANNMKIDIDVIRRTNSYHSLEIEEISSATSIRNAIVSNIDYNIAVPSFTKNSIENSNLFLSEDFFKLIKYKIISSTIDELKNIHLVEEGLEFRMKKVVSKCGTYQELVHAIATKRYTYSRVSRMLYNVLMNYTKSEKNLVSESTYYRVLGFNNRGQDYLKLLKNKGKVFDVNIKAINNIVSDIEYRASNILKMSDESYNENRAILKEG